MALAVRVALVLVGALAIVLDSRRAGGSRPRLSVLWLLSLALGEAAFVLAVWLRHRTFPLHLELMEGAVLEHVQRLLAGQPLYPPPSARFVPFAYNPLYYVLAAPLIGGVGGGLPTLRALSIAGALGAAVLVAAIAARRARSWFHGVIALGLFAAAYEAMDAYLDTAHADAWLILAILAGTALVEKGLVLAAREGASHTRGRALRVAGVVTLVAGFWLKQHGALFALAALACVVLRLGARAALPEVVVAVLLGPVAYLLVGPRLFGPWMLFYTWTVPRSWSVLSPAIFTRVAEHLARGVPLLTLAAAGGFAAWTRTLRHGLRALDPWQVQLAAALGSGFMGALDAGGNDNVLIPLTTFAIVMGVSALPDCASRLAPRWPRAVEELALVASFALLLYDPRHVWTAADAPRAHAELVALVRALDAPVFAPDLGPSDGVSRFTPPLTWVAIEDLVRGARGPAAPPGIADELLAAVATPAGAAYILTSQPLERRVTLAPLLARYRLETDFGERFASLRTQPMRWGRLYPRYLYRYSPPPA